MGDSVSPILVVGSVALDTVHTPTESATDVLGGGASYFCVAASMFAPIQLVAVVGDDFHRQVRFAISCATADGSAHAGRIFGIDPVHVERNVIAGSAAPGHA